jgi:hypothetical protein
MSPATVFQIQLVLGYVPWLLLLGAYVLPKLKSIDQVEAHRAMSSAPICRPASRRSRPTATSPPASSPCWRY